MSRKNKKLLGVMVTDNVELSIWNGILICFVCSHDSRNGWFYPLFLFFVVLLLRDLVCFIQRNINFVKNL